MKRFKNILYVHDRNAVDPVSLERAAGLAESNQGELTLLEVHDLIPFPARGLAANLLPAALQDYMLSQAHERLDALVAPYRKRIAINTVVAIGTPFMEIIRQVLRHQHDLVIKAAGSEGPLEHHIFGTTDMHLIRKCPCPVWLMKHNGPGSYRRIMAAVGFEPGVPNHGEEALNHQILEMSSSLALSDFGELHVVHAWDALWESVLKSGRASLTAADIAGYVESERQAHQEQFDRLIAYLDNTLGKQATDYIRLSVHMPKGAALKIIPELAAELQADLLVMGTVGRSGVPGLLIGNTAENILNQLNCSVLAIKPPGFVTPVTLDE